MTLVGIVANPASGRDIRRLVAGASVFGNSDKAGMVLRLLAGLGAAGVERALMMPAGDGLSATLHRQLRGGSTDGAALEELPMRLTGTAADTERAVAAMRDAGVAAIAVLGGDGTHRIVAKGCGDVPLCALSTGTNNAFPELRETTVAGLATGLVATGRGGPDALRRESALAVSVDGAPPDLALVDVAVTRDRVVGARALWRGAEVSELLVAFASPSSIGLSSVAGMLASTPRGGGRGLYVRLAGEDEPAIAAPQVALAPGLVAAVRVAEVRELAPGEVVRIAPGPGVIALDGEREIERSPTAEVTVELVPGPRTIDVDTVMRAHATRMKPGSA
jgi:hypothetical protein